MSAVAASSPAPATRVAVLCANEVLRHGLVALLPQELRQRITIVADLSALEEVLGGSCTAAIIDADLAIARLAVRRAGAEDVSVVVLAAPDAVAPWMLEEADAILLRDHVDQLTLRMALAAGRVGMRLVPRDFSLLAGTAEGPPQLGEDARRVLALLADGRRDAEMARKLDLSESAVRKLVQRTVHAMGARTRCEAIAIAARSGQLDVAPACGELA